MKRGVGTGLTWIMAIAALALWAGEGHSYTFFDENLEFKGFVRTIAATRTDDPAGTLGGAQFEKGDVHLFKSFLQLEGSYVIAPEFRVYGRWRGAYDGTFDLNDSLTFPQAVVDDQKKENEFRELYVDVRKGNLFLRLGKQQVIWGESDGLRLADIINPLDLSWHYLLENWEDIRIGLPMVRAIYSATPKTDLELVWSPVTFEPMKFAGQGTYWELPGLGIGGIPEEDVSESLRNGSVGGKVRTIFGSGFEVSLYDYYHRNELPAIKLSSTGLVLAHPYVNSIGGTFNTNVESLKTIFRGESVFTHNEPQLDFTKPDFISKKDSIAFMLGFDRPTVLPINSESTLLSFQVFYKEVLDTDDTTITFGDVNNKVPEQIVITGLISTSYPKLIPNGTLTLQVFAAYDTVGAGWVQPKVNLRYGDNWNVAIASNQFWGHDNSRGFFNPVNDRSEAYVDIKYSFQ